MGEAATSRGRLDGMVGRLVALIAIGLCLFVLYSAYFGPLPNIQHRAILLCATMVMGFLIFPARASDAVRSSAIASAGASDSPAASSIAPTAAMRRSA